MAVIREELVLADKFSGPWNKFNSMGEKAVMTAQKVDTSISKMATSGNKAADTFKAAGDAAQKASGGGFSNLVKKLLLVTGIYKGLGSIKNLLASVMDGTVYAKKWQQFSDTFKNSIGKAVGAFWKGFGPAFDQLNKWLNSPQAQKFFSLIAKFAQIAGQALGWLVGIFIKLVDWISDHLPMIAIILGTIAAAFVAWKIATIAQTIAQWELNTALATAAITIGIIAIAIVAVVALIYWAVDAFNNWAGTSVSATGIIAGAFMVLYAVIYNIIAYLWNYFAAIAEFWMNVWNHPMYSVKKYFGDLIKNILDMIIAFTSGWDQGATNFANSMIDGINAVLRAYNWFANKMNDMFGKFGINIKTATEFDHITSITSTLEDWKGKIDDWVGKEPDDYKSVDKMEMKSVGDAWKQGYQWGDNLENSLSNLDNVGDALDKISGAGGGAGGNGANINSIKEPIKLADEDSKLLVDLATRDYVVKVNNQTLTPTVTVQVSNTNGNDLDEKTIANSVKKVLEEQVAAYTNTSYI